jgi:hypothetical protein
MGILEAAPVIVSAKENIANTKNAINNWNLGALDVDAPNNEFWRKMAKIWLVDEKTARTRICGNCEYYENTPEMLEAMTAKYPLNEYDIYDSFTQRGYCHKLDFSCHNPRVCQAWERKDFENEDM